MAAGWRPTRACVPGARYRVPTMSFDGPDLALRPDLVAGIAETWRRVAGPGAGWTGEQRLAIASEARRAWALGGPDSDAGGPLHAAGVAAARPSSIRRTWIDRLVAEGLDYPRYVELVGVASRVVAVDTLCTALGLALEPFPDPQPGDPTGELDSRARLNKAWVPMVGGASITQALSLVPSENAELERLHGVLYLTFEQISDPVGPRALIRPQMELVAARTSARNECFY